jgi:hypothetical protein
MNSRKVAMGLSFLLVLASCGTDVERTPGTGAATGGQTAVSQVLPIEMSVPSGYYASPVVVTLQTRTPDADIYCTQDGTDPTKDSTRYTQSIRITRSTILRCRAFKEGMNASAIAEGLFVIAGSVTTGNGLPPFHSVKIELAFAVDDMDLIRIQNGMMNLIHVNGQQPQNPWVQITRSDGSVETINPWTLTPFQADVSAPLDLKLTDFAPEGFGFIPPASLGLIVGRDSVSVNGSNQIVVHDGPASFSAYDFIFEYWYTATSN